LRTEGSALNGFIVFAHRGASGHEPENTLRSFKKALELGASWIEIDVYAVENELVVIHDDRLERTTNGTGLVMKRSLQYLRSLDAGKGERIPLLRELFELIGACAGINVELKGPHTAKPLARLIGELLADRTLTRDQLLVSSFDHRELRKFRKLMPEIRIGALIDRLPLFYARFAEKLGAWSVNVSSEYINRRFVDDAHQRGLKVYVYTVNDRETLLRMRALGVNGVFTNYPELADELAAG
jgi:glycerophosphoryl diester phosphodiesterase